MKRVIINSYNNLIPAFTKKILFVQHDTLITDGILFRGNFFMTYRCVYVYSVFFSLVRTQSLRYKHRQQD